MMVIEDQLVLFRQTLFALLTANTSILLIIIIGILFARKRAAMKIFDSTKIPLLSKALSAYSLRLKVSSSNIANINSAGYRAQAVGFEETLNDAARVSGVGFVTTDPHHLSAALSREKAQIVDAVTSGNISDDQYASGVNNVDIDYEMSELAQTQIRFKYASRLLGEAFRGIQKSIRGQV